MNLTKYNKTNVASTLVLSLALNNHYRNYYMLDNSKSDALLVLDEFSPFWNPDYYSIYYDWKGFENGFRSLGLTAPSTSRWWSFCPEWALFKPCFIHDKIKAYFSNAISKALDGVAENDLSDLEKKQFKAWIRALEPASGQLSLFN